MTLPHIIYIPFVLTVGFFAGWYLASRSVRGEWERAEKRRKEREGA
jgi:hypothetical protein